MKSLFHITANVYLNFDVERIMGCDADQADYLRDSLLNWSKQDA